MKFLDVVTILLGPGNQIHNSVGGVNDWSSGNSDFGDKIRTSDIATRYRGNIIRRIDETYLPERRCIRLTHIVSIKRVHSVVLGGYIHHVMNPLIRDGHVRYVERLSVDISVQGMGEQLTECIDIHVGWSECKLTDVLSGAGIIIVVSGDTYLCRQISCEGDHGNSRQICESLMN